MAKFCENCGAELKENAKFCSKCGYKIPENNEILENNEEQLIGENTQKNQKKRKGSARKTAAKKDTRGIATKIIAVVVAIALVGVGVGAGYIVNHLKDNKKSEIVEEQSEENSAEKSEEKSVDKPAEDQNKEEKTEPAIDMEALLNEVDTDYLLKVCTYLPVYSSPDQISDDDLYKMYYNAMQYCMQYHADLGEEYACEERQIIPDDQFITMGSDGTGSFNKTSFDKFCELTGITKKPEDLSGDVYTYDDNAYYLMPTDAWFNGITCRIVERGYDEEKEEILINIEKKEDNPMDSSDEAVVTEETVVIVPSDNTLGYQMARIDSGYTEIENIVGVN